MVSTGGLALSRVSNRFAVGLVDSSPSTNQPKLLAGLSSHDCTSAIICAELHTYWPTRLTDWLALTVGEKSPPCVVQKIVSPRGIVGSSRRSAAFFSRCMGCSFSPVDKQLVQLGRLGRRNIPCTW